MSTDVTTKVKINTFIVFLFSSDILKAELQSYFIFKYGMFALTLCMHILVYEIIIYVA